MGRQHTHTHSSMYKLKYSKEDNLSYLMPLGTKPDGMNTAEIYSFKYKECLVHNSVLYVMYTNSESRESVFVLIETNPNRTESWVIAEGTPSYLGAVRQIGQASAQIEHPPPHRSRSCTLFVAYPPSSRPVLR